MGANGLLDMAKLDPLTRAWVEEYRFLKIVPMTHEQYLDTDALFVRWMLEIDSVMNKAEGDAARANQPR